VVAEGLSMYLGAEQVRTLLGRLTSRFAHGRLVLDVAAPWVVATSRRMPGRYRALGMRWAPRGPDDVLDLAPDLRFVGGLDLLSPRVLRGAGLSPVHRAALDAVGRFLPSSMTVTRWEF
jgi:O-methyltransferase involved in polyketide biosynthesis